MHELIVLYPPGVYHTIYIGQWKERIFFCSDRDESSAYERLSIPGGTFIQRLNYSPLEVMELGAIPDVLPASQKVEIGNFVL